jgi:hypothetical protein
MSFRNSTIVTGSALGLMLALGAANNASGGHDGYGYAPENGRGAYHGYQTSGYFVKTGMHESKKTEAGKPAGDIVDVAVGAGSFTTLVEAVKAADLVETLRGEGPFTFFAPTDEAFAKIAKADLDAMLADKEKLTAVLSLLEEQRPSPPIARRPNSARGASGEECRVRLRQDRSSPNTQAENPQPP